LRIRALNRGGNGARRSFSSGSVENRGTGFFCKKLRKRTCVIRGMCEDVSTMNNKSFQIVREFATVTEAMEQSGMDISYNPQVAKQNAKDLDRGFRGNKVERVFLTDDNRILYVFKCDILLLNEFSPFHGILDDSKFDVVFIRENSIDILETGLSRSKESRAIIGRAGWIVTTL
jgi:hypothetical protein